MNDSDMYDVMRASTSDEARPAGYWTPQAERRHAELLREVITLIYATAMEASGLSQDVQTESARAKFHVEPRQRNRPTPLTSHSPAVTRCPHTPREQRTA